VEFLGDPTSILGGYQQTRPVTSPSLPRFRNEQPHQGVIVPTSKAYAFVQEQFPHIAERLKLFWGYPELVTYVHNLLLDTRTGVRKGFSLDVVTALNNLLERHHVEFPALAPSGQGIWVANNKVI
jgi:hypothetical protein